MGNPKRVVRLRAMPTRAANAFAKWVAAKALTAPEIQRMLFADAGIEVTTQAVYHWLNGKSTPRLRTANVIATLSKGAVPAASW